MDSLVNKINRVIDRYDEARIAQNEGRNCPHCNSPFGHYVQCPLINCNSAEAHSLSQDKFTETDVISAHALGVKL